MPMQVRGQTGYIKAGYQQAAVLGPWHLQYGPQPNVEPPGPPQGWTLTTTAREVDLFWLSRERFDLVLVLGKDEWRWRNVEVKFPDCQCEFTIQGEGRPEIRKQG